MNVDMEMGMGESSEFQSTNWEYLILFYDILVNNITIVGWIAIKTKLTGNSKSEVRVIIKKGIT